MHIFHNWSKWSDVEEKTITRGVRKFEPQFMEYANEPQPLPICYRDTGKTKEVTLRIKIQNRHCFECGIVQERSL